MYIIFISDGFYIVHVSLLSPQRKSVHICTL
nr:MAG TPA: Pleckstrin homology domain [Caudoviricetes sp.]